jgi:DNA invertase Pin-like site-specific DNA recombinase
VKRSTAVGYLRVSTQEQGRSGIGLAVQRSDIEAFAAREGFSIKSWHQDVQTGAGADALLLRPGVAAALKEVKSLRCPLIVARLDRLSRNVHFISWLMENRVHFIVAALGKNLDQFTLHIWASVAEQERQLISDRNKAARAVMKARGIKMGMARYSKARQRQISALANAGRRRAARERAEAYRPYIEWALRQPGIRGRPISLDRAAQALNERGIPSPSAGRWGGEQLMRMGRRLGLHHPPAGKPKRFSRGPHYRERWVMG